MQAFTLLLAAMFAVATSLPREENAFAVKHILQELMDAQNEQAELEASCKLLKVIIREKIQKTHSSLHSCMTSKLCM
jgi:hypothetical protein